MRLGENPSIYPMTDPYWSPADLMSSEMSRSGPLDRGSRSCRRFERTSSAWIIVGLLRPTTPLKVDAQPSGDLTVAQPPSHSSSTLRSRGRRSVNKGLGESVGDPLRDGSLGTAARGVSSRVGEGRCAALGQMHRPLNVVEDHHDHPVGAGRRFPRRQEGTDDTRSGRPWR
jgi:hypothetical protein